MTDYQKLYLKAFNGITDTILSLQRLQQQLEEEYVKSCKCEDVPNIINLQDILWDKKD